MHPLVKFNKLVIIMVYIFLIFVTKNIVIFACSGHITETWIFKLKEKKFLQAGYDKENLIQTSNEWCVCLCLKQNKTVISNVSEELKTIVNLRLNGFKNLSTLNLQEVK